jgi:hypothetical protein
MQKRMKKYANGMKLFNIELMVHDFIPIWYYGSHTGSISMKFDDIHDENASISHILAVYSIW